MDGREAFSAAGRFHRGNIHTHSTRSDGALSPGEVCGLYSGMGYDFLCLSDHFLPAFDFPITDTNEFRGDGFTTILGAEIHAPQNSQGEIWHVLACGLPADFDPPFPDERMESLARRARDAGAFVGIAHPQWSSLTIEDGRALADVAHAVEIWNTGCAIETGRGDGTALLDQLLNEGHRHLTGYATDDAHLKIPDAGGGWMMVKAETNRPDALLAAMKDGLYYSSQGPAIEAIETAGDTLLVRTSPARMISLVGRGSRAETAYEQDGSLVSAELSLKRVAGDWCRVVVCDDAGKLAWSNPIFPD
ncbi:CehA/McbA family metallohydrolase [Aurantimonas sp. 22II-16-19i]|uniref:CehA/McbA family metallohydrolase n=1 Tax=Aurantimonas sp. 22II-16-19i TaxID=1317114 RepID=UPI0009F7A8BE|nr:CehA/McbA family metallohydrolase [Aurantimonas sp. 22II-16-19i]ORE98572.1 phosphotransferase domain-containing protein [Aurantimonas sp. 22II-16-19i]